MSRRDSPLSVTRREFIETVGVAAAGTALGTAGCQESTPVAGTSRPFPVGVAGGDPSEAVALAIERAGGMRGIGSGMTVVVKPNATGPLPPPTTTNPEVLRRVVQAVKARNPKRIIVAERSFVPDNTRRTMSALGYLRVAAEEGAEAMPLDDEEWVDVFPEGLTLWPDGLRVPKISQEADALVLVPVAKGHFLTNYTMALKLMFGYLHPDFRVKYFHNAPGGVALRARMIAELNLAFKVSMVVLDATKVMPYGGPVHHIEAEPGLVIASPNPTAADAAGLALFKSIGTWDPIAQIGVWDQPTLVRAAELGYGAGGPQDVRLNGPEVELADLMLQHLSAPPISA